jgi:hypothetical protein
MESSPTNRQDAEERQLIRSRSLLVSGCGFIGSSTKLSSLDKVDLPHSDAWVSKAGIVLPNHERRLEASTIELLEASKVSRTFPDGRLVVRSAKGSSFLIPPPAARDMICFNLKEAFRYSLGVQLGLPLARVAGLQFSPNAAAALKSLNDTYRANPSVEEPGDELILGIHLTDEGEQFYELVPKAWAVKLGCDPITAAAKYLDAWLGSAYRLRCVVRKQKKSREPGCVNLCSTYSGAVGALIDGGPTSLTTQNGTAEDSERNQGLRLLSAIYSISDESRSQIVERIPKEWLSGSSASQFIANIW